MISRYTYRGITWIDLESPSKEEVLHIMEEFSIPNLVGEEMLSSTLRSKVELYKDLVYVILHFPTLGAVSGKKIEQEIDFIIGKDFLVTVRYETVDPIHEFSKLFEKNSFVDQDQLASHGGYIFVQMMRELYKHSLRDLDKISKTIREIEYFIFNDKEEAMVKKISHTSRKLLDFKQALRFHDDVLRSYENASVRLFGAEYAYYAGLPLSEFNKVNSLLESNRDVLSELQRTNDSLLSTKTNDTIKVLTIMSFVMMPLTLITGVFGMNVAEDLVFISNKSDFFIVVGAMIGIGLIMFIFFKVRRWL